MATISKDRKKINIFSSIKTKFSLAFITLTVFVLVLMNTYFMTASRDMIFTSKQSSMQNQATVLATSLAALDALSEDDVKQAMDLLDVEGIYRIIVTDSFGAYLYDTTETGDSSVRSIFDSYYEDAIAGNDIFFSRFSEGVFSSCAFTPIISKATTMGLVFIYEHDEVQGDILLGLQSTLKNISLVLIVLSVLLLIFVLRPIMKRITTILAAIISVREGEYNYRIQVSGNDELTQLGDEFNSLTTRLQQTEEVRRRFVADASHELKTPLASIRLLSDSILQNDEMSPDMVREFVSDIGAESERLARTTEKLLTLTKLDHEILKERTLVDLRNVVIFTLRMLKPLAESSGVSLDSSLDDGCIVDANEDDMHEIVFNLVENAIKYNLPGGSVGVTLICSGEEASLYVDDTGIGVPDQDLPFIFDRFYRVDKARSREAGGSGLGLAIVKTTAQEYGGRIEATHRTGGGMRFAVTFPLAKGQK